MKILYLSSANESFSLLSSFELELHLDVLFEKGILDFKMKLDLLFAYEWTLDIIF